MLVQAIPNFPLKIQARILFQHQRAGFGGNRVIPCADHVAGRASLQQMRLNPLLYRHHHIQMQANRFRQRILALRIPLRLAGKGLRGPRAFDGKALRRGIACPNALASGQDHAA